MDSSEWAILKRMRNYIGRERVEPIKGEANARRRNAIS